MDVAEIIKLIAPIISSSPVGSALGLADNLSWVLKHFLSDNPEKLAKAEREFSMILLKYAEEVGTSNGQDVTEVVKAYNDLYESK